MSILPPLGLTRPVEIDRVTIYTRVLPGAAWLSSWLLRSAAVRAKIVITVSEIAAVVALLRTESISALVTEQILACDLSAVVDSWEGCGLVGARMASGAFLRINVIGRWSIGRLSRGGARPGLQLSILCFKLLDANFQHLDHLNEANFAFVLRRVDPFERNLAQGASQLDLQAVENPVRPESLWRVKNDMRRVASNLATKLDAACIPVLTALIVVELFRALVTSELRVVERLHDESVHLLA